MKINFYIAAALFFNIVFSQDISYGYLRGVEASMCMDECSNYMLENESSEFITYLMLPSDINEVYYIDRYVEIQSFEEYQCMMCNASIVSNISLSDLCEYPVSCVADPCEVDSDCEINTPVECIANYCGGCYADFYDLDGNIVDCFNSQEILPCDDVSNIFFGMCDMFLGYAVVEDDCQGVSGCGWDSNGIDYSSAFFNTYDDCIACFSEPDVCEDIEYDYDQLHSGDYILCEQDSDCISVWGDCGVGLGGCHYSVNEQNYQETAVDYLVNLWVAGNCMEWVCDCLDLPGSVCNDGLCELSYCMDENPQGCFSSGCLEGYACIDYEESGDCVPSWCGCDEFYGDWFCTEDCNGGTCFELGDVSYDGNIDIVDIVTLVNIILGLSPYSLLADVNSDSTINIIDVILIIDYILE